MPNYYVINCTKKTENLLCADTAQALGLIQFAFSASLNTDRPTSAQSSSIADSFLKLFDGKLEHIKGTKIKLHVNPEVQPIAQQHRRIPFHLRKQVEAELNKLQDLNIVEPVIGPTPWVSPIVCIPKKRQEGVRVCVDMREPNRAIEREKHPMPTLDHLIADLNGAKVFSKLDMTQAYHQLEIDEDSRQITTFATHVGLFRYKRLLFGVKAASEIFQNVIATVLQDIPGVRNLSFLVVISKNMTQI